MLMNARGQKSTWRKMQFPEWETVLKMPDYKSRGANGAMQESRELFSPPDILVLYSERTAVNGGCKHDSSFFFSSAVTWSRALLDGKILDLVCSGDSTQACKVIRRGLLKGCCDVYPATLVLAPCMNLFPPIRTKIPLFLSLQTQTYHEKMLPGGTQNDRFIQTFKARAVPFLFYFDR